VEADEGPVSCHLRGLEGTLGMVADHESDIVAAKKLVDLRREPALVAEFEAVPAGGQALERGAEAVVVAAEGGRQLPEHRAELGRAHERLDPVVEELDSGVELPQPLDVGEVAARLDREQEVRRSAGDPVRDHLAPWQAVEGGVHLDRVEVARVEGKPLARWEPRRVEDTVSPVAVVPAGTADPDLGHGPIAAESSSHSAGVAAATTRERPVVSSGAASKGLAAGRSIASPRSRTRSCAAAMSTARAFFSEQTPSTR